MILVTATGKVGAEACLLLAKRGVAVRLLARHLEGTSALVTAGVDVRRGDLSQPDTIDAAMHGVDGVVLTSPGADASLELNAVDSARRSGTVAHIVKATSLAAADSPIPRQREQARVEAGLEAAGIPYTLLRSNFYMQNLLMQAGSVASTDSFASSAGDGLMGLVDSRDVAEVAATVAADPAPYAGVTLLLTGPALLGFADVADILGRARGRAVTYVPRTADEDARAMVEAGVPPTVAASNALAVSLVASGSAAWLSGDVAATLGRPPRSFEDFAGDHAARFV